MAKNNRVQAHSPEPFHLVEAKPEDFAVVASLFEALHCYNAGLDTCFALADGWHALLQDYFQRTWDDPQMLWLLAWREAQPAGLLIVKMHTDSPLFQHRHWTELMAIYVDPACRRTGLGERLVDMARAWTAAHGAHRLQLYVTASNERAQAFYRRCGLYPVQEIWRLDVQPDATPEQRSGEGEEMEDPEIEFLEPGHRHLGGKNRRE